MIFLKGTQYSIERTMYSRQKTGNMSDGPSTGKAGIPVAKISEKDRITGNGTRVSTATLIARSPLGKIGHSRSATDHRTSTEILQKGLLMHDRSRFGTSGRPARQSERSCMPCRQKNSSTQSSTTPTWRNPKNPRCPFFKGSGDVKENVGVSSQRKEENGLYSDKGAQVEYCHASKQCATCHVGNARFSWGDCVDVITDGKASQSVQPTSTSVAMLPLNVRCRFSKQIEVITDDDDEKKRETTQSISEIEIIADEEDEKKRETPQSISEIEIIADEEDEKKRETPQSISEIEIIADEEDEKKRETLQSISEIEIIADEEDEEKKRETPQSISEIEIIADEEDEKKRETPQSISEIEIITYAEDEKKRHSTRSVATAASMLPFNLWIASWILISCMWQFFNACWRLVGKLLSARKANRSEYLLTEELTKKFEEAEGLRNSWRSYKQLKELLSILPPDNLFLLKWMILNNFINKSTVSSSGTLFNVKPQVLLAFVENPDLFDDSSHDF